jgi:hypothetical protein
MRCSPCRLAFRLGVLAAFAAAAALPGGCKPATPSTAQNPPTPVGPGDPGTTPPNTQPGGGGTVLGSVMNARGRSVSANNLKDIGLAMHNYHDAMGKFPAAATYDGSGKPLLSWRVALLPYLEHNALFQQFKLDEAWDGPHNKPLLAQMPKKFAPVQGQVEPNSTYYQVFAGPGSVFEGRNGCRISDVQDGLSNTFLVVEAGEAVPWTKPEDIPFDPQKPLPKLGAMFGGDFNALLGDGSVKLIRKSIDEATLKALITRNGNEVIDPSRLGG